MFTVTESAASALLGYANGLLILGTIAVLIGTIGAIWMGSAKEHFANERISANEVETARAKEAAAVANQKAEAERVERLKLELKLAPRMLTGPAATVFAQTLTLVVHGIAVDVVSYEGMGTDVAQLSQQIAAALRAARATANVITPGGGAAVVNGVLVRTAADASAKEVAAIGPIVTALNQAGIAAAPYQPYPANEPPAPFYNGPPGGAHAKLRILVGAKPQ